ncbi:methyl-accepting chemotaxis sensory transducer with Pas/Pac sensor [Rhizobium sp. RU36D]|nr:methyl-accepting chemotaxis sensory transducer with Pas/Pac sensor [Rhizobium sp. RU36D]
MLSGLLSSAGCRENMAAISSCQALVWFKPDGTVMKANDNFCKAMGYELNEIVGKHHRIFCEDAIRNSPDYKKFWDSLANGEVHNGHFRRQTKAGNDIWLGATYNPIKRNGKVVAVMKIAVNITPIKISALNDENRLRAIDKSQAIIEFEPDGKISHVNENFLTAMGYSNSEVIGQYHRMFCEKAYADSADYVKFWERLRSGEYIADNFVRIGKGGKLVWIQAAYTPVFNTRGQVYKVIKVATDITPRMVAVETIGKAIALLAKGDLTVAIDSPLDVALEQTRQDFNLAARALESAILAIRASAEALSANANVINDVSSDIAKNAEKQAASVEETASALEEMTTTVKDSSRRAEEAGQLVATTRASAENSGSIVEEATAAMEKIAKSSGEISNIIGVIDEIAFQTNLLALNAGVEAARAGDAGKGFAVVAQEVRELAQRSANAAKEIKGLISTANDAVRLGVSLVNKTGVALNDIVQQVQSVDTNVDAIATSAREQALGIGEINQAINALDQGTQKNAATVEEANAASQSLAQEAQNLYALVNQFKVGNQQDLAGSPRRLRAVAGR